MTNPGPNIQTATNTQFAYQSDVTALSSTVTSLAASVASPTLNLALIGDSRIQQGERLWWKNATQSTTNITGILPLGIIDDGITADSSGTLEFDVGTRRFRWTAPSDTAGAWVSAYAGRVILSSGTSGKRLMIGVKSLAALPTTTQSDTISCSGNMYYGFTQDGPFVHMMAYLRQAFGSVSYLSIGGNQTDYIVTQLPWINAQSSTSGYDVIWVGTNDVMISGRTLAAITADYQAIISSRLALNRKIILVGENARLTAASAAISAAELAKLIGINTFLKSVAAANVGKVAYVDTWSLTADPAATNGSPVSGILKDYVHPSSQLAERLGPLMGAAMQALGCPLGPEYQVGDVSNKFTSGWITASGGSTGTGGSGTVPADFDLRRASGSAATVAGSFVLKTNLQERAWQLTLGGTAAANDVIWGRAPTISLATLGKAVGDTISGYIVLQGNSLANVNYADVYLFFNGASPNRRLSAVMPPESTPTTGVLSFVESVYYFPPIQIPTGTTSITFEVDVQLATSDGGNLQLSKWVLL